MEHHFEQSGRLYGNQAFVTTKNFLFIFGPNNSFEELFLSLNKEFVRILWHFLRLKIKAVRVNIKCYFVNWIPIQIKSPISEEVANIECRFKCLSCIEIAYNFCLKIPQFTTHTSIANNFLKFKKWMQFSSIDSAWTHSFLTRTQRVIVLLGRRFFLQGRA